jgi:hypothetical protein
MGLLPKKLWTYWDGDKLKPGVEQCVKTWKHHLGDSWEINIVNNKSLKDLVPVDYLPRSFDDLDVKKRSDSARVALLRRYGGVWSDSHVVMLEDYKWLEQLFDKGKVFVGYANPAYSNDKVNGKELIESWWFASMPESAVITAWNRNWVTGVNEAKSPSDFTNTAMFKNTDFPAISKETKNYLFIAVALRHARDTDPATIQAFKSGQVEVLMATDGPIWHWKKENRDVGKLNQLKSPRLFKFIQAQHKHADEAAGNRSKMDPFYKAVFDANSPKIAEPTSSSGVSVIVIIALLFSIVVLLLYLSLRHWKKQQIGLSRP